MNVNEQYRRLKEVTWDRIHWKLSSRKIARAYEAENGSHLRDIILFIWIKKRFPIKR